MIIGYRHRSLRHQADRGKVGALRRAFRQSQLHRRRAAQVGGAGRARSSYAKRFAAKEACAKALGTGLSQGVFWRDMGVVNLPSGKPTLLLTGGAALKLADLTPQGYKSVIHLTLTDEYPFAQAHVLIEALALETLTIAAYIDLGVVSQMRQRTAFSARNSHARASRRQNSPILLRTDCSTRLNTCRFVPSPCGSPAIAQGEVGSKRAPPALSALWPEFQARRSWFGPGRDRASCVPAPRNRIETR